MAHLYLSGKRMKIPPFPHHKVFIQRASKYFFAKSPLEHFTLGNGAAVRETLQSLKNGCFIPRGLLMDPTTACNLHCTGCWAADYDRHQSLSYDKLHDILNQAESLGIEECLMTGGEPMLRKEDILRLARAHRRTIFGIFTNGQLVDEAFVDAISELGNVNLFLSIEGWKQQTDARRGEGVYDRVVHTMDLLRSRDIAFGISVCYTAQNVEVVSSDAFLDFCREKGAWFGWLFQYLPIGSDADLSLAVSPDQRSTAMRAFETYSHRHGMLLIDFWNLGHLIFGCIGAGTGFVHINANGDVEPCAFCHYSDANIHQVTLKEALQSPFFQRFRAAQPFSKNPLLCCPLRNADGTLAEIVRTSGAHSTHAGVPETAEALAEKMRPLHEAWEPVADALFSAFPAKRKRNVKTYQAYLRWKRRKIDSLPVRQT